MYTIVIWRWTCSLFCYARLYEILVFHGCKCMLLYMSNINWLIFIIEDNYTRIRQNTKYCLVKHYQECNMMLVFLIKCVMQFTKCDIIRSITLFAFTFSPGIFGCIADWIVGSSCKWSENCIKNIIFRIWTWWWWANLWSIWWIWFRITS